MAVVNVLIDLMSIGGIVIFCPRLQLIKYIICFECVVFESKTVRKGREYKKKKLNCFLNLRKIVAMMEIYYNLF